MAGNSKIGAAAAHLSLITPPAGEKPEVKDSRWLVPGACIFLAVITFAVFGQTLHHEFVNYDDNDYVYENSAVTRGLNLKGIEWAFTHSVCANWHPLTIMSHMLDCRIYGLNAGGHHLTSVLLHTATAILLFLMLRRMTGFLWRSAFVAAVFAVHPLRAESVAWVAERKDVLSGLFFMLTLWAYTRYAEKSKVRSPESKVFYGLVLLFFALGLMCKPMLVTLPFVLLLLDYWPLNRFAPPPPSLAIPGNGDSSKNHSIPWRPIIEKIPLLSLTGAACVATMMAQKDIIISEPLVLRIGNAMVSCVVYLRQMVCPAWLAVLYPYPQNGLPGWEITLAVVLLAAISAGVILRRKKEPYLLIGWLWYLGMLVPAIGLIQSGWRAHADRYTYLSQIGLYFALTWAAADLCAGWRHRRVVLGGGATVILVALIFCARGQTFYWRNSESLWTHTLACTSGNYVACYNLGSALFQKGRVDEAITYYQKALQINPDCSEAHNNLGEALCQKGKVDEAIVHFQKALENQPDNAEAHNNLAWLLATSPDAHVRDGVQAVKYAGRACELTHYGVTTLVGTLAAAYAEAGRYDDAIVTAQKACALAEKSGEQDLLEKNQKLLELYRAHQPYHEAAGKFVSAVP